MPGSGKMICKACGLITHMTGSLASHDPAATVRGYQCQACGGSRTHTRYAFCPKCRSMDESYQMGFIT